MSNKYWSSFKRSYHTLLFELHCHFCTFQGILKTKLFFNKLEVNKLEIGIGKSPKKTNFISSDLDLSTDYPYDLRLGLPFPDASIDLIYAEHVLEHFSYIDLKNLVSDCHRVLKPHGIFSVVIPDASIYIQGYNNSESFDYKRFCAYDCKLLYKSKIDYTNYIFYMDGHHRHMFDKESILNILENGGFSQVQLREFDPLLDQQARQYESIYAEGIK